jgi:cytochrome P450
MDYMPHLQAVTGRLLTKWKKDASSSPLHTITINHDLSCMTVDGIGRVAFGVDYNALGRPDSQEVKDVQFTFNRLLSRAMSPIKLWKSPMMARLVDPKASQVQQRIYKKFSKLIQQEQLRQQQNQVDQPTATFLSKVVRNSNGMPLHRLHGNLQTMLMAGADTTSSALMVCFFKIASDQTGLQDELLEEANLLPDLEWPLLSLEVLLNTVPRIRSLFYEVVRFMGPGPQMMCQNKFALEVAPGVSIPPGSSLILPLQYLGTQPGSGIPPRSCGSPMHEFCARRWCTIDDTTTTSGSSTGRVTGVLKPSAKTGVPISTGFGGGVRMCPGQLIAEAEAVLCLAFALREFHVSLPPDHGPLEMMSQLSAVPRCDIRLVLKERNNNVPPPSMT